MPTHPAAGAELLFPALTGCVALGPLCHGAGGSGHLQVIYLPAQVPFDLSLRSPMFYKEIPLSLGALSRNVSVPWAVLMPLPSLLSPEMLSLSELGHGAGVCTYPLLRSRA